VLVEAAIVECWLLKKVFTKREGAPGSTPPPYSRLPRQAIAAWGEVVAALMLAGDAAAPEPRFKGAERVVQAPLAAAALPWEEEGWTPAPAEFATAAEVCAALEMTARLLAALPEFIARLPAELQGASSKERVGQLAKQLWGGLYAASQLLPKLDLEEGSRAAAAAAAADLLASVAKLAGAVGSAWPFPGAPQEVKLYLAFMLRSVAALLKRCFCPLSGAASAAQPAADLFRAAAIAGVAGLRSALALTSNTFDEESLTLAAAAQLTCHALCPDAACARPVARHGGFELLEGLVARVFDPVSSLCSAAYATSNLRVRLPLSITRLRAGGVVAGTSADRLALAPQALQSGESPAFAASTLEMFTTLDDAGDSSVVDALAASAVPATLAAWAAAKLRAGHRAAVAEVAQPLNNLLVACWLHERCRSVEPRAASRDEARLQEAPKLGQALPEQQEDVWSAALYKRMAAEILPQGARRLRTLRAEEAARPELARALALAEARALATRPCANPRCAKIAGCREREARGRRCSGCMVSRYCCRECQVAGWRAHKGVCGALGAAREAAAEA
jgi:hypothetical protein